MVALHRTWMDSLFLKSFHPTGAGHGHTTSGVEDTEGVIELQSSESHGQYGNVIWLQFPEVLGVGQFLRVLQWEDLLWSKDTLVVLVAQHQGMPP